jgi:hypothetical protein
MTDTLWLPVFDNVEDEKFMHQNWPNTGNWSMLIHSTGSGAISLLGAI